MDELGILENAEETATIVRNFATIGAVYEDGVSLIFDGEDAPTEKHYLCNTSTYFKAGDRVKIATDSGTYVVEYAVGAPKQQDTVGMPRGGDTGSALIKNSKTDLSSGAAAILSSSDHTMLIEASKSLFSSLGGAGGRIDRQMDQDLIDILLSINMW